MELYWIVIFAVFINSLGGIWYIRDTLKGITKPNKVTWGIWAVAPLIGSAAIISSQGFVWSVMPVFMAGFIPLLIFISSFINKNSYWQLGKLDYICLLLAILALILWFITSNPLLAIIFGILADFIAAIPLLIKMYNFPETETIGLFFAGLIASLSSFLVIENWILEEYLFPLYLVIICILFILAFYKKRIFLRFNKKNKK